jgi:hypothetical protein
MAVPMSVTSTMWSRRPTAAGQSRTRARICMPATTTPSAPSRLTSSSSRRLASRRVWLTSAVQPAISALPDHGRACRVVIWSSCREPIAMPSASPAGTQPAMTSRAKSCPDTAQVKGTRGPAAALAARTAVPAAVNCSPRANGPGDSLTPTTPWPPSAAHSAVIRSTAARRTWCIASTSGPNPPASPRPVARSADGTGISPPAVPGQLDPLAGPAAKTAAPNTCPTGANPTLPTAASSWQASRDPHAPSDPAPVTAASSAGGSSSLTPPSLFPHTSSDPVLTTQIGDSGGRLSCRAS